MGTLTLWVGGVIELNVRMIRGARSSDLASRYEVADACIYVYAERIGLVCLNVPV